MVLGQLQFNDRDFRSLLNRHNSYGELVGIFPDHAEGISGRLVLDHPSLDGWCAASHLNVSEAGVGAPIFYAVDQVGGEVDETQQMRDFASGGLCEFINVNVANRPTVCQDRHTRVTIPIAKEMLCVWLHSHNGKVEAPLDPAGLLTICLCLGVALDTENGEGVYLLANKDVVLTDEQSQLRLGFQQQLDTFSQHLSSVGVESVWPYN